jgi:replication-associated recombination protein RarA
MIEQLKDMILPFRIMNIVDNLTANNIQSFLFHGEQGVGKSLTARLLSEKLKMPTLNLDLSTKGGRGVDSLEDIRIFIDQKTTLRKIIIINEVDNLSSKALETLKNLMDEYCVPDNNRAVFLLTTNHINNIHITV